MDVVWNLTSVAVGAVVTWLVARYYYKRAAMETRDDLAKLIQEVRDTAGEVKQMIVAFS